MTGKYKRKSLPNNLEVRGISRGGGLETYTQALHAENEFIPREFTETINDAISNYESDSDRSSPITAQYLEASNNNWTANLTGNTTDRSSSYSTVTYDDFDKEASLNVQRLFDDIDSMLFGSDFHGSSQLFDECKDWSTTFPHLRVVGVQLLQSSDQGYHVVSTPTSQSSTYNSEADDDSSTHLDSLSYDSSSLTVEGMSVRAKTYSAATSSTHESDMSHLHEEIIAADGYYEDIIAIDSDQHEDPLDSKTIAAAHRQRRSRYPPVTPNACAKDDIVHSVFDIMWNILTDSMRILLQRYSEHFVLTHPMVIPPQGDSNHGDGHLKLPQIHMPGSNMDNPSLPLAQNSSRHGWQTGSVISKPSPYNIPGHNNNEQLRKILQISKVEMSEKNRREKTFTEGEGSETPLGMMQVSTKKSTFGARNTSANAGRRVPARSKLAPLNDRTRTPIIDDEMIKGRALAAVGKRLSSPPNSNLRMLPPINQSDLPLHGQQETTPPPTRGIIRRGNRASSAIAEKEVRPMLKEKAANIIVETRPSTTHTVYPTDQGGLMGLGLGLQSQLRSMTPMDRVSHKLRGDLPLGITGSSLIGPNSALDEEVEGRYESVNHHSQWAPPHTATGGYRRNKTLNSSFVR